MKQIETAFLFHIMVLNVFYFEEWVFFLFSFSVNFSYTTSCSVLVIFLIMQTIWLLRHAIDFTPDITSKMTASTLVPCDMTVW